MSKKDYVEASHHQQYHPPPPMNSFHIVSEYPPPPPPPLMKSLHPVSEAPPLPAHVYQEHPPAVEGVPVKEEPPLACGIGFGWILFILGFFFTIPWYIGAITFICSKIDPRERPGCIGCTVGAVLATIAIIIYVVTHYCD